MTKNILKPGDLVCYGLVESLFHLNLISNTVDAGHVMLALIKHWEEA